MAFIYLLQKIAIVKTLEIWWNLFFKKNLHNKIVIKVILRRVLVN